MTEASTAPFVFISYSRGDSDVVLRLRTDLQAQGLKVWIDQEGLQPGTRDWEEDLQKAIRAAQAVLLIASPNARSSRYVKDELRIAEMYQRPVYPLWVAGSQWMEAVPFGWGGTQYIDARDSRYLTAVQDIVTALSKIILKTPTTPPSPDLDFEPRNPYKGLKAFTSKDTQDFFGRESLIDELAQALGKSLNSEKQTSQDARLLAVVGSSGSGKSSIVMAGLLPQLQVGKLPGSSEWLYLDPIVPGEHPIEILALALWEKFSDKSLKAIREDLEDDSARTFHLLATSLARGQGSKVLLFIDQFEELFTQTVSEEERRHFIDVLVAAITEPHGPVIVILTLRGDFYDRPFQYAELGRLLQENHIPILPMELKELRSVIEKPATLPDVRLTFDGELVGDLLFEVQGQAGALPLLQFTLDQLFQLRSGRQLTLQSYHEIGGVKGALAKHAESTYECLPSDEHRQLARMLLLRLIDPGTTEQDTTRRRAPLSELILPDPLQTQKLRETADAFIAARLLQTNTVAGIATLEVSHEALIREWRRLADWLLTNRSDILLQSAISEDAAEWLHRDKPEDRLYRGTQLVEAQKWAERNMASSTEVDFLRTSTDEQERREREERERIKRELELQRRLARRQRYVIGLMAVVSLVVVAGLVATLLLQNNLLSTQRTLVSAQRTLLNSLPVSVTNLNDVGVGSLREAITAASDGSAITFAKNLKGTIHLNSGILDLHKNISISGPGASLISISGYDSQVFHIYPEAVVTISNLTIENGNSASDGGGIYNEGSLTLTNAVILNNTAPRGSRGGGIYNLGGLTIVNCMITRNRSDSGGGIYNNGGLLVTNSTVSDNTADTGGGGIYNQSFMSMTRSTMSGNSAQEGGGLFSTNGLSSFISNSTISGNTANADGGGIFNDRYGDIVLFFVTISDNSAMTGGGIVNTNSSDFGIQLSGSIVANNRANSGADIRGSISIYYWPSLIENISNVRIVFSPSDTYYQYTKQLSIFGVSPNLGPLQNNGGPTMTHALLAGSPAINDIPSSDDCGTGYGFTTDQRGLPRPGVAGGKCDLGAYQHQGS